MSHQPEIITCGMNGVLDRSVNPNIANQASYATPQGGIEPVRPMGKWIVNEIWGPGTGSPPWLAHG